MRKYLIGLVVIIILVILLLPYIFGQVLCNTFKKQVLAMNKRPNVLSISVVKYDKGWFSTNAELLITQPSSMIFTDKKPGFPKHLTYQLNLQMHHGPLTFITSKLSPHAMRWGQGAFTGQFKLVTPVAKYFPNIRGANKPVQLLGAVSMHGNIHFMAQTNPLQILGDKKFPGTVNIGAVTIDLLLKKLNQPSQQPQSSSNTDQKKPGSVTDAESLAQEVSGSQLASITGNFHINGITVKHQTIGTAPDISGQFDYVEHADNYFTGKSTVSIPTVTLTDAKQNNVATVKSVSITMQKLLNKQKVNISQQVNVASVNLGEAMQVKNIKLDWALNNASLAGDLAIEQEGPQFSAVPKARRMHLFIGLLDKLLLGSNLKLTTLQADVPQFGHFEINGSATLPKQLPPGQRLLFRNLMALQTSQAELNLSVPAMLLKLLPPAIPMGPGPVVPPGSKPMMKPMMPAPVGMIHMALSKGYIKKQGDNLVSHLVYKDGQILANGKPFSLAPPVEHKPVNFNQSPKVELKGANMPVIPESNFKAHDAVPMMKLQPAKPADKSQQNKPVRNDAKLAKPMQLAHNTAAQPAATSSLKESTAVSTISVPNKMINTSKTIKQQTKQMDDALSSNPNLSSSANTKQTPARED